MRYVTGGAREAGCIFCNRLGADDDVESLILLRGDRAFVIMNLYPYNTGHVMIVPNAHFASPENADPETSAEMTALRGPVLRALRRALSPDGFNLGLNLGAVAGAGVIDHLHEHVVPRWQGDTNFMPVLASTVVMPETISVTYAKIRAELDRASSEEVEAINVVMSRDRQNVLIAEDGGLPRFIADAGEPVWRGALRDAQQRGAQDVELAGWAGESRAGAGPLALFHHATFGDAEKQPSARLASTDALSRRSDRELALTALARFSAEG